MASTVAGPIFVINDHEWTARSIETLLVTAGHQTIRAFTGAQLEELLAGQQPDAIILDLQLPDVSALDLLPRLRERGLIGPSLPVILTTAGPSGRQMRLRASEAGAWEFFGQPLDGGALLAKLQVFLAAYRAGRPDGSAAPIGFYAGEALERRVAELGALARRSGLPVSCVALSVEGCEATSEARLAAALRHVGRAGDALGHLSPGHYVVLAYGADAAGAERLAERLRGVIQAVDASITPRVRLVGAELAGTSSTPESLLAAATAELAA